MTLSPVFLGWPQCAYVLVVFIPSYYFLWLSPKLFFPSYSSYLFSAACWILPSLPATSFQTCATLPPSGKFETLTATRWHKWRPRRRRSRFFHGSWYLFSDAAVQPLLIKQFQNATVFFRSQILILNAKKDVFQAALSHHVVSTETLFITSLHFLFLYQKYFIHVSFFVILEFIF